MNERIDPAFSIVTPSFKMLGWLKLCAASVADQTGVTFEHIVQDGGTGPELEAWAKSQPRLRCCQEPDRGMYDAINRALKRARGQYLAYLNCDEQYLPGTLNRVGQFFADHPHVEVLFGDAILVDSTGHPLSYRRVVRPKRVHLKLDHLNTLTCATFFRRSVIEKGLLFDSRLGSIGDAVWVYSLLEAGISTACLGEPLAVYTFTGANDSESERPPREIAQWRREHGAPPKWMRRPAVLMHRLQKMAAGAYRKRDVSISIYTFASPTEREEFRKRGIHYGWPGATAPSAAGCESYKGAKRPVILEPRN